MTDLVILRCSPLRRPVDLSSRLVAPVLQKEPGALGLLVALAKRRALDLLAAYLGQFCRVSNISNNRSFDPCAIIRWMVTGGGICLLLQFAGTTVRLKATLSVGTVNSRARLALAAPQKPVANNGSIFR